MDGEGRGMGERGRKHALACRSIPSGADDVRVCLYVCVCVGMSTWECVLYECMYACVSMNALV